MNLHSITLHRVTYDSFGSKTEEDVLFTGTVMYGKRLVFGPKGLSTIGNGTVYTDNNITIQEGDTMTLPDDSVVDVKSVQIYPTVSGDFLTTEVIYV